MKDFRVQAANGQLLTPGEVERYRDWLRGRRSLQTAGGRITPERRLKGKRGKPHA